MIKFDNRLMHGVAEIDTEHKALIDKANAVINAYQKGDNSQELLTLLDFLNDYVVEHFTNEEALQQEYDYPKYHEHRHAHEQFKQAIDGLAADIKSSGLTMTTRMKLNYYTTEWIIEHIGSTDKELSEFILAKRAVT